MRARKKYSAVVFFQRERLGKISWEVSLEDTWMRKSARVRIFKAHAKMLLQLKSMHTYMYTYVHVYIHSIYTYTHTYMQNTEYTQWWDWKPRKGGYRHINFPVFCFNHQQVLPMWVLVCLGNFLKFLSSHPSNSGLDEVRLDLFVLAFCKPFLSRWFRSLLG